jgi:hypothetical protein
MRRDDRRRALESATVTLDSADLRFVARSGSGQRIELDDGHGDTGPRPAELEVLHPRARRRPSAGVGAQKGVYPERASPGWGA